MDLSLLEKPKNILETAARILLGAVFIYASWDKILNPAGFAEAIGNYQILPPALVNGAALLLPWIEMVCGICLICGRLVCGSALLAVGLFIVFIGALAYSAYRGLDIQCGCFSLDNSANSNLYLDLFRDLVLLAIAFMVLLRWRRPARLGRPS
jgi:uncharacterized membrane protein YphA (DoxX/SURF4 family)